MALHLNNRSAEVDLIRGLAVLSVLSVHTFQVFNMKSQIFQIGQYGVELFFLISGFLMSSIYSPDSDLSLKTFARRRASRLLPLWLIFLTLGLLLALTKIDLKFLPFKIYETDSSLIIPAVILFGATFNLWISERLWNSVIPGGWSIQCEVYNYLIFALTKRYALSRILVFTIVLNATTITFGLANYSDQNSETLSRFLYSSWLRFGLYSSFSYFMLGVVAHNLLLKNRHSDGAIHAVQKKIYILSTILLISLALTPLTFGNQVQCMVFCLFLLAASTFILKMRFVAAPVISMGKYSYSIYFIHFYLLTLIDKFDLVRFSGGAQQIFLVFFVYALVCLVSWIWACLTWKFLESPVIRYFR